MCCNKPGTDIERLIGLLKAAIPELYCEQHVTKYAADDDGVWWFMVPGSSDCVQIDSSTGNCPLAISYGKHLSPARYGIDADNFERAFDIAIGALYAQISAANGSQQRRQSDSAS